MKGEANKLLTRKKRKKDRYLQQGLGLCSKKASLRLAYLVYDLLNQRQYTSHILWPARCLTAWCSLKVQEGSKSRKFIEPLMDCSRRLMCYIQLGGAVSPAVRLCLRLKKKVDEQGLFCTPEEVLLE